MAANILPAQLERSLRRREAVLWTNDRWTSQSSCTSAPVLDMTDVYDAEQRLLRCSGLFSKLFPELAASGGVIESDLYPANDLRNALMGDSAAAGRWFVKADHALPVAGSIKARGGIYEVLWHAENLALRSGLLRHDDDRLLLASTRARQFFARHRVSVGSTGNLGLSVGVMAAALGFQAAVHMSSDAKEWKKARLRAHGVVVVEHRGDYGAAVAAGRAQAESEPNSFFVDDERSKNLFLGYSVAVLRLAPQLADRGIVVDAQHPLFVYLPCGVGGAPGGITFGLRHLLGDHVHCFFAEPVAAPCMLMRLASLRNGPIRIEEVGLDNRTEADGLAVGQASEFVALVVQSLISGVFTVPDDDLLAQLFLLEQTEGLRIEPSAAAGFGGPRWLLQSEAGRTYLEKHGIQACTENAAHILWTTGGAFVPDSEYRQYHERGELIWRNADPHVWNTANHGQQSLQKCCNAKHY